MLQVLEERGISPIARGGKAFIDLITGTRIVNVDAERILDFCRIQIINPVAGWYICRVIRSNVVGAATA